MTLMTLMFLLTLITPSHSNDPHGRYGLGQTYEILTMYYYALYYYRKATALRPYDARMWCAMAGCYKHLRRTSEAIKCYQRAETSGDREGIAFVELARLFKEQGTNTRTRTRAPPACKCSSRRRPPNPNPNRAPPACKCSSRRRPPSPHRYPTGARRGRALLPHDAQAARAAGALGPRHTGTDDY